MISNVRFLIEHEVILIGERNVPWRCFGFAARNVDRAASCWRSTRRPQNEANSHHDEKCHNVDHGVPPARGAFDSDKLVEAPQWEVGVLETLIPIQPLAVSSGTPGKADPSGLLKACTRHARCKNCKASIFHRMSTHKSTVCGQSQG